MSGWIARRLGARLGIGLLILSLVLPMLATPALAAVSGPRVEKLHAALGMKADQHPSDTIRVIVQGDNSKGELEKVIRAQGGLIKKKMSFIKGFSVDLPAKKIRELSRHAKVKWISEDAKMVPTAMVDTAALGTVYPLAVKADQVWNGATSYTGSGVTVAVMDSGLEPGPDFGKVLANVGFSNTTGTATADGSDVNGHGTHVAGIIAANGTGSNGKYVGVAPGANLVNVKVSDSNGVSRVSDVVLALQWVVQNKSAYNIRVVNLSLNSSVAESYLTSPLDAAVEIAWLSGITVVVSAGNAGANTALYPPANDPFVISVGAVDTNGTAAVSDDLIPSWSSFGTTQDGFSKPEVVAPGRQIVSDLAPNSVIARQLPDRIVDTNYIRLSGTSMSAPVVSGVVALVLQAHPDWTPDQVKSAVVSTARSVAGSGSGRGEVDAAAAVAVSSPGYANNGIALNPRVALAAGSAVYSAATWSDATWSDATWSDATWSDATWSDATWSDATWSDATWSDATWSDWIRVD